MTDIIALNQIRTEADRLGVSYHHNAGVPKIREAIDLHLDQMNAAGDQPQAPLVESAIRTPEQEARLAKKVIPLTEDQYRAERRKVNRMNVGALVRCRVQCMNPSKKDWAGEIISVGSAKLGTFKKYVPFNSEPYHIPKIIYDMMVERKCSVFFNSTDDRGHQTRKARQINEYAIEVLDPLTPEELKDLAHRQGISQGTGIQ